MEVDVCDNLLGTLERISGNAYCAVIADIRLEGTENTDGLRILRETRENQPDVKVVLMTGYGNSQIEKMSLLPNQALPMCLPHMPESVF